MRIRRYLLAGFRAFFGALLLLWLLDAVVNLKLLNLLFGYQMPCRPQDFLGLLVADSQVALVLTVFAWMCGPLVASVIRSRDATKEAVVLLAAGLSALFMASGSVLFWHMSGTQHRRLMMIALVSGVVLWIFLRIMRGGRRPGEWSFGDIVETVLFPALIVGFGNQALALAFRGGGRLFVVVAAATILSFIIGLLAYRMERSARKSLLRWSPVAFACALIVLACVRSSSYGRNDLRLAGGSNAGRPDIVLIVLDTVRADHLRCYGYSRDTMPKLEKWAEDALIVKRAVAPSGWTSPTHASLFSGLPVSLHGIHGVDDDRVWHYTRPFESVTWLPEMLSELGYYCLAVSSNHHALPSGVTGFDRTLVPDRNFWLSETIGAAVDFFSPLFQRVSEWLRWRMPYVGAREMVDTVLRALPEGDAPVFLFVNFLDAHAPYNPPERALEQLGSEAGDLRLFGRYRSDRAITDLWKSLPDKRRQYLADLYDGELRGMDEELDRLLRALDQRLGTDGLVVIVSDHGEELGEEGRVGHSYGLPQSLLHVPLFVRSPTLPKGELEDIVSIRGLCGFIREVGSGQNPGADRLRVTDEHGVVAERYLMGYNARTRGPKWDRHWVALFDAGYKALGPSDEKFELFDIREQAFDRPVPVPDLSVGRGLQERIDTYWDTYRDLREEAASGSLSEEELQRLRALGYIR